MSRLKVAWFLAVLVVVSDLRGAAAVARARVTLSVIDSYGAPIDFRVVSFKSMTAPSVELASGFHGSTLENAELGERYSCVISLRSRVGEGFVQQHQAVVSANNSVTVAVISMPRMPSITLATPPVTQIRIVPYSHRAGTLTRAVVRPAFSTVDDPFARIESTVVDDEGGFSLQGLHGGMFIVTIFRDAAILAVRDLEIPQLGTAKGQPIILRISQ